MKKGFNRSNLKILRIFDQNDLGSVPRIFLSCLLVVLFFYVLPIATDFTNNQILKNNEYQNNSKKILAYTLNNGSNLSEDGYENLDERDLLVDIYSLNEKETDAVRLDASTIKQLFEDTDYKLKDIRKNKLVKPIALDSFPLEIKMIENTKKRKDFFIQIVLPLILQENNNIRLDRKTLFSIINKSNNTELEKINW